MWEAIEYSISVSLGAKAKILDKMLNVLHFWHEHAKITQNRSNCASFCFTIEVQKLATYFCQTNGKIILSVLCKPVPDTLYVEGSDFKDVSLEACQNLCKADRSCTFYTWNQRTRVTIAIYAPMIYTAPCVMLLMQPAYLRGQVGGGWALEIESF